MQISNQLRNKIPGFVFSGILVGNYFLFCALMLLLTACSAIANRASGSLVTEPPMPVKSETLTQGSASVSNCPVSRPVEPVFIPPHPHQAEPPIKSEFWYGSPSLWTLLPLDGTWDSLLYDDKLGYTQKILFWRAGYDPAKEPQPDLRLSGVRLDGKSETFTTSEATHAMGSDIGSAMLVGVDIPTSGCWQITAIYGDEELRFTVRVEP